MNWFYKVLSLLGLMSMSFANGTHSPSDLQNNTIQQTIEEMNQSLDPAIHLELLRNCPEVIPILADWLYEDWSRYDRSLTKEKLIEGYRGRLSNHPLPFALVAFKDHHPIGVISLKEHELPELADFENGSLWVGSLHVVPEERNRGLGETLAKSIVMIAKRMGCKEIRFYLSESQGVSWCVKRGAEVIATRSFHGHQITILRYQID